MANALVQVGFNYDSVDDSTAAALRYNAINIRRHTIKAAEHVWRMGKEYAAAQERLANHHRGLFVQWVESETPHSYRTAYNAISVYQRFSLENFSELNFATSALYELARPSTPEPARLEAIKRAEDGEAISHSEAKEIVQRHKTEPVPSSPVETDDELPDEYDAKAEELSGSADSYDWTQDEPEPSPHHMDVHYSSDFPDWETPQELFDLLDAEFGFTLDVCATDTTAKCQQYFTPEDDGLTEDWSTHVCWMNPPYGDEIRKWMDKASAAARQGATVVCLVPARIDTGWWWDNCIQGEVRFLKGRLRFRRPGANDMGAPFPSAIVVLEPERQPATIWWNWKNDL